MPSHQLKCPYIPFGTVALIQHSDDHDHDQVCTFEPQEGDSCWARLDPTENVWNKGFVMRKVIAVPDFMWWRLMDVVIVRINVI